jgi:hypothetical protein
MASRSVLLVLAALATGLAAPPSGAQDGPTVVELFTSQGCSSCPPADAFLGELAQRPNVIALAFHVDYWDRLGWRDPFSSAFATERQKRYAQALRLRTIYTPQMVIDGTIDAVGSDRTRVSTALRAPRRARFLRLEILPDAILARLEADALAEPAEILAVAYRRQSQTAIPRGENAGRTASDFNIVLAATALGAWNGHAKTLPIARAALPAEATDLALLLQSPQQGVILAAGTATLPERR